MRESWTEHARKKRLPRGEQPLSHGWRRDSGNERLWRSLSRPLAGIDGKAIDKSSPNRGAKRKRETAQRPMPER